LIWDQHAPPLGIASLSICLVGGVFYQQAPMRATLNGDLPLTQQRHRAVKDGDSNHEQEDETEALTLHRSGSGIRAGSDHDIWQADMTEVELDEGSDSDEAVELLEAPDGISKRRR
jgi:hypothetical protein